MKGLAIFGGTGRRDVPTAFLLVLACVLVLPATATAKNAGPRATADWLRYADRSVCGALKLPAIPDVAEALIEILARKRIGKDADVVAAVVVGSAQLYCRFSQQRAVRAVGEIRANAEAPAAQSPVYSGALARLEADVIAGQLQRLNALWLIDTASEVRSIIGSLCRGMRQMLYPVWNDLERWFPGADLDALQPLSGIVSATARCTPPLSRWQIGFLNSAAFNFLVANTYRQDLEPPTLAVGPGVPTRYTDHVTRVTFNWRGYDRSGISRYVLFVRLGGGAWRELSLQDERQSSALVALAEGYSFQFALQATDYRGNQSAWAYTGIGTT